MKPKPVRQVRGVLGLCLGVGATVGLLYLAGLLSPLGDATGFVFGPIATLAGAAIGALIGGLAAGGAIMFSVASAGFAMGAVWLVGGETAALLAAASGTLIVTGLAVLALFSDLNVGGGEQDGDAVYEAGWSTGLIAAAIAAISSLIADGWGAAAIAGSVAGVVTGAVVAWVMSTINSL